MVSLDDLGVTSSRVQIRLDLSGLQAVDPKSENFQAH